MSKNDSGTNHIRLRFRKHKLLALALIVMGLAMHLGSAVAAVATPPTVTPATGGSAISADTTGGTYTTLTGPVLAEGDSGQIGLGTIILNAPAGFVFDTANSVTATFTGTGNCGGTKSLLLNGGSFQTVTPTSTNITVTVSRSTSSPCLATVTWTGIKVRPSAGTPLATGNISSSGTSVITGLAGGTNFGTLTEIVGASAKLAFSTQPSTTALVDTDFVTKPVVVIQDQFGNQTAGTNSIALTARTGATTCADGSLGSGTITSTTASGTNAVAGQLAYTAMEYSTAQTIKLCASATGLASALSNAVAVTGVPPEITGVSSTLVDGYYNEGVNIDITVTFDKNVIVTGTPRLQLETGVTDQYADYVSAGPGTVHTFRYVVSAGDESADLDYLGTTSLILNGGTINDLITGTPATLTLPALGSFAAVHAIVVDTTAPTLTSVSIASSNADDAIAMIGDTVTVSFTSDEDIQTPTVAMVTIDGFAADAVLGGPTVWTATRVMTVVDTEGVVAFTIDFKDLADNSGTQVTATTDVSSVTFDKTVPDAPTGLDLFADDDTGSSNSDDITKNTTNLTISGSAEADSTVELFDGITSLGTSTSVAGAWTMDIPLANGVHNITATATDVAGNTSLASGVLTITVDTTSDAPTGLDLDAADDTGSSNSDDITKNITGLTISGSAEAGSTVELFVGAFSLGTITANGAGAWTMDIDLAEGVHDFTAIATDIAGNISSASGALTITVDTTNPTLDSLTTTDMADPFITSPIPFTVSFSEPVTGFGLGDIAVTNGDAGNILDGPTSYTFDVSPTGSPVLITVDILGVIVQDLAGNNNDSANKSFSRDFVSNKPVVTLSSTATDPTNAVIPMTAKFSEDVQNFVIGDISVTTANATVDNFSIVSPSEYTFNVTSAVPEGLITVVIPAGVADDFADPVNTNFVSSPYSITFDEVAPNISGVTYVPVLTNDNTPSYTFNSSEAGAITYGGGCTGVTTAAVSGVNTINFVPLTDGTYNCTVTVTDAAGNVSSAIPTVLDEPFTFKVDTTPPVLTQVTAVPTPTTDNTPNYTFSSSEAGAVVFGGACSNTPSTTAVAANNVVTFDNPPTGLANGTYSNCTITVTDAAGNSSVLNVSSFVVNTSTGGGGGGGGGSSTPIAGGMRYFPPTQPAGTTTPGTTSTSGTSTQSSCQRSEQTVVPFTDTVNNWAITNINNLYINCVVDGKTTTTFDPNGLITRAELLKMVLNAFDLGISPYAHLYNDVEDRIWYSDDITHGTKLGIVEGYNDGSPLPNFRPNRSITRAEALKVILRGSGVTNFQDFSETFTDVSSRDWFEPYVAYAQHFGFLEGYSDGTFRPNASITRAEAAKIIDMLMK